MYAIYLTMCFNVTSLALGKGNEMELNEMLGFKLITMLHYIEATQTGMGKSVYNKPQQHLKIQWGMHGLANYL